MRITGYMVSRDKFSKDIYGGNQRRYKKRIGIFANLDEALECFDKEHMRDAEYMTGYNHTFICPIFSDGTFGREVRNRETIVKLTEIFNSAKNSNVTGNSNSTKSKT